MLIKFESACLPLQPQLFARAMQLTRERNTAQDLVQDTLLRALTFWADFRIEEGEDPIDRAGAWLQKIMMTVFLSGCRRRSRDAEVMSEHIGEVLALTCGGVDPDVQPVRQNRVDGSNAESTTEVPARREPVRRMSAAVARAIGQLPADFAEAVTRVYFEGQTPTEAVRELGVPADTVRTRLLRARRQIATALAA